LAAGGKTGAPARDCYDLNKNMVGDRGLGPLLEAIDLDNHFQKLLLRGNNLRNRAALALADVLSRHHHVQEVDLRDNVISQTGGNAILETIKNHPGLKAHRRTQPPLRAGGGTLTPTHTQHSSLGVSLAWL